VAYLGHVISKEGVAMDGAKVEAIATWPQPRSARGLRGFHNLAGYYRRFNYFGVIAAFLTQLHKKDAFMWSDTANATFTALNKALTMALVLQLSNFTKEVDCDASGAGFGMVLHRGDGPIALFSR
jgi:hypothetical protein